LIAAGAIYGLAVTAAFGYNRLEVRGTTLTSEDAIRARVALTPGENLVGLATEPIAARVRELPSVRGVDVSVGLPDVLVVDITERRPIVVWAIGERRFAVDDTGLLFADVGADARAGAGVGGIPVVRDDRALATALGVASVLDPVDLDAATRLGSLTPIQINSHAGGLHVRITDDRGFTVNSGSGGWLAVFGFYGRSQRTPALIPGQVQLLAGLIAGREDTVATMILADEKEGTYLPKATPRPTRTPKPTPKP
ncbi:MAG: FtsQ-type POTRA domain-containing protein, partial [Chloroflexi bacterium]|nr:FtsQ-type POTRA domain-containing protein [Chloroflexota bacterium]